MPEPPVLHAHRDGRGAEARPGDEPPPRPFSWQVVRRLFTRLTSSPLARRVASGAVWSVLGAGLSRGLALLAAVLVARQLGAVAFGEYNLVQTTAGMFQVLAGLGLGATATKYLSGRYRADPDAAGRVVALSGLVTAIVGTIAALVMAMIGPWLARELLGAPQLASALQIGSLMLLFGSVFGAQYGVLTGLERFRLLALVGAGSAAVSIPLLVLGARVGGMNGAIAGLVASTAVTTAMFGGAVRVAMRSAGITPRYASAFREWRILVSFSVPATLSNLLLTPVTWISSAIIAHQPDGFRELGLFAAANQWRNAIVLVATSAGAVLFPVFSHLHDSGRSGTLSRAFWASLGSIAVASLIAALSLSPAAPALMRAYGSEFSGATRVFVVMVITGAVAAPLSVVNNAIFGAGRMWLGFGLTLAWACVLLFSSWMLRDRGAMGLSMAYLVAYLVHLVTALGGTILVLRRAGALEASRQR